MRDLADQVVASGARRVLLVPPDQTRLHSRAGEIVAQLVGLLDGELDRVDVMPALGTHQPLGPAEARLMFGDAIDPARLLHHRWRDDVTTIGELLGGRGRRGRRASSWARPAVRRQPCTRRRLLRPRRLRRTGRAARGGGLRRLHEARLDRARRRVRRFSAATSSAPSTGSSRRWGRIDAPVRQLLDLWLRSLPRAALPGPVRAHRRRGARRRVGPARRLHRRRRHALVRRRCVPRGRRAVGRGQHRDGRDAVPPVRRLPRSGGVPLDVARRTRRSTARGSRWRTAAS